MYSSDMQYPSFISLHFHPISEMHYVKLPMQPLRQIAKCNIYSSDVKKLSLSIFCCIFHTAVYILLAKDMQPL